MSEGTSRRDRGRRSDRRSNYDDYGYEEEATPDGYEREAPYDSLYKRSFDARSDDQRPRSGHGSHLRKYFHDSYDDDANYAREQRQLARRNDDDDRVRYDDQRGHGDRRDYDDDQYNRSSQQSRGAENGEKQLEGLCGKEKMDIAATAIGAVAGAFLGHEAGHGKPIGTLGGAVLGGLSANAVEHGHLKREERREGSRRASEHKS